MSQAFPYSIPESVRQDNPQAVFRMNFDKKYFIFKGMKVATLVAGLSNQIGRELMAPKEYSMFFKTIAYIKKSGCKSFDVMILHATDNAADLLLSEYQALQAAKNDPNCLNTSFVNNEKYPAWIPQTAINDFTKLLQGVKIPNKHKNLHKYIATVLPKRIKGREDLVDKIVRYVTTNFR